MCILFIANRVHPDYPLIVCANRDEFHHRPTAPAHFWPPTNDILAGQDLLAGGTWLGVNTHGGFAALTNIRAAGGQRENMRSRGELVLKALAAEGLALDWLQTHSDNYNPFNLVFQHRDDLLCFNSLERRARPLAAGFHAVSNGSLDEVWPKMARGEQALEVLISRGGTLEIPALLAMMRDESQASDETLPDTGFSREWERRLSAIYIRHEEYGTRSTSILLQDKAGARQFVETRFDGKGRQLGLQQFILPTGSQPDFTDANPTNGRG
jgi:uncharacterized protein with NRDE domain